MKGTIMELLKVIKSRYGTIIMRPSWQNNVLGLQWEDDTNRPIIDLAGAELYFEHPDSEQTLMRVRPGERIAVKGIDMPAGLYWVTEGGLALIPQALSNWGITRVWVCGNAITAIQKPDKITPTRLTGHVLNQTQGSEWLYGAACAAGQFGTPFMSPVIELIKDGEYMLADRNDGSKAWLEVAQ
jgi:hypothetical protein